MSRSRAAPRSTGSSRGFGRSLATAALEAGDNVVATARRPEELADLVAKYGDRILPVALDVTDAATAEAALAAGLERFGRIDVVVNNAGYANLAPVETVDEADFRGQFETNFWGVYNVSRAALPLLKKQGSGVVIQFSSIGGRVGRGGGRGISGVVNRRAVRSTPDSAVPCAKSRGGPWRPSSVSVPVMFRIRSRRPSPAGRRVTA